MPGGRPAEGQALSLRARLAVAAYVILTWPVMTAFLFGPLAVLIAAGRPRERRPWLWLIALTLWLSLWASQPGGLLEELVRAAAVVSTGVGVLFLLLSPGSVSTRALRATAAVAAGTSVLAAVVGVRWADIELAVVQQGMLAQRLALDLAQSLGLQVNFALFDSMGEQIRQVAPFFPGYLALLVFIGLCLAALLAPRITGRALTPLAGRFNRFRFSDHLVWLVILGLLGTLFAGGTPAAGPAASLLAFGAGLYALRGTAVLATALKYAPPLFVGLLVLGALFLFPFAVGGLILLGLADTWLDFRRRMAPPPPGGLDP